MGGLPGLNKNEQTLIINSDGTQATLITPVVSAEAAVAVQAEEMNAGASYGGQTILTAPAISFPSGLNVESLGKEFRLFRLVFWGGGGRGWRRLPLRYT
jgi:hypothetical protein